MEQELPNTASAWVRHLPHFPESLCVFRIRNRWRTIDEPFPPSRDGGTGRRSGLKSGLQISLKSK